MPHTPPPSVAANASPSPSSSVLPADRIRRSRRRWRVAVLSLVAAGITTGVAVTATLQLRRHAPATSAPRVDGLGLESVDVPALVTLTISAEVHRGMGGQDVRITMYEIPGTEPGTRAPLPALDEWMTAPLARLARQSPDFLVRGGGVLQVRGQRGGWPFPWLVALEPIFPNDPTGGPVDDAARAFGGVPIGPTTVDRRLVRIDLWPAAGSFIVWWVIAWIVWTDLAARRELRARRAGRCGICGYALPPTTRQCPECGAI